MTHIHFVHPWSSYGCQMVKDCLLCANASEDFLLKKSVTQWSRVRQRQGIGRGHSVPLVGCPIKVLIGCGPLTVRAPHDRVWQDIGSFLPHMALSSHCIPLVCSVSRLAHRGSYFQLRDLLTRHERDLADFCTGHLPKRCCRQALGMASSSYIPPRSVFIVITGHVLAPVH
jgi:hypothetical protein